jgi:exosortase/archaeosortase family protein
MVLSNKKFIYFTVRFLLYFLVCYYGLQFITGLAVEGGYYNSFVAKYIDIASWIRSFLMFCTSTIVSIFGYHPQKISDYVLTVTEGGGIRLVYGCLGFGVLSFWTAYSFATDTTAKKKITWFLIGIAFLFIINIFRITAVLIATNKKWQFPFGWNHHTWFNIVAYAVIFMMMYFFEKNIKQNALES